MTEVEKAFRQLRVQEAKQYKQTAIPFPMPLPPGKKAGTYSDILQLDNEKTREKLEKASTDCIPHVPQPSEC